MMTQDAYGAAICGQRGEEADVAEFRRRARLAGQVQMQLGGASVAGVASATLSPNGGQRRGRRQVLQT